MLTVRVATPDDAADVAGVHVRSWKAAYRGLLPDGYLNDLRSEDRMARYTLGSTDPGSPTTLVAVTNGVLCGFATIGPCRDTGTTSTGEVLALYVDPDAWGLGVGRRLIAEARASLSQYGFVEAVLWVLAGNARAQRFYAADGWLPDDRRRMQEVWGVRVDELRFRRRLRLLGPEPSLSTPHRTRMPRNELTPSGCRRWFPRGKRDDPERGHLSAGATARI